MSPQEDAQEWAGNGSTMVGATKLEPRVVGKPSSFRLDGMKPLSSG